MPNDNPRTMTPNPLSNPQGGVLTDPEETRKNLFIDIPPMSTRRRTNAFETGITPGNRASNTVEEHNQFQVLLRKEVIQPHLPVRLPCYDFTPLTLHTFGASPLSVGPATSGADDSGGVTGGVYKARERIHRGMLIRDY